MLRCFWYSFPSEAESTPGVIVGPEGLCQRKIPMTQSGIEPAVPPHVPADNHAIIKLILKEATKKKILTFQTPIFVQIYSPKLYVIIMALYSTFKLSRLFEGWG